jgi:hypothetical protein
LLLRVFLRFSTVYYLHLHFFFFNGENFVCLLSVIESLFKVLFILTNFLNNLVFFRNLRFKLLLNSVQTCFKRRYFFLEQIFLLLCLFGYFRNKIVIILLFQILKFFQMLVLDLLKFLFMLCTPLNGLLLKFLDFILELSLFRFFTGLNLVNLLLFFTQL